MGETGVAVAAGDRDLVLASGETISFVDAGDSVGLPVLYFHGTPSSRLEATGGLEEIAVGLGLRILAPDRPGCGRSSFVRYTVPEYATTMAAFADALGIDDFAVVGVSGGGRYACACAAMLGLRVRRVVLVGSTAPPELPGVQETWRKQDRRLYGRSRRMPWLARRSLAKLARDIDTDPEAARRLVNDLSVADERALKRSVVRQTVGDMLAEAFRQGPRGVALDLALEGSPWGCDLSEIRAPVDLWHGLDDTIVSARQAELLAAAIPRVRTHLVPGGGHLALMFGRRQDYLEPLARRA